MAIAVDQTEITYCEGARLLQVGNDIGQILIQRQNGNLVCQHCYLVVADSRDVQAISPDDDWQLLASCHIQACASLHDRRAAFSCYACQERGEAAVETDLSRLKSHISACELMRGIKLSAPPRKEPSPAPSASRKPRKARNDSSPTPVVEAAPVMTANAAAYPKDAQIATRNAQTQQQSEADYGPPLPGRPKKGVQDPFDTTDMYNTQSIPRRKEVKAEMGLPTPPSRAPPAPPLLYQPGHQTSGAGRSDNQSAQPNQVRERNSHPSPLASHNPRLDTYGRAENAKIRQLVNLGMGISPTEAEHLLSRSGGDVNLAAEYKMSG